MTDGAQPRRRAGGFLGMVALVALIEMVVGTRHDLVDPVAMQWRYRARAVRTRAPQAEVLCLGDSLVKFGVAAPVLGQKLGRVVGNHAVLAAPAGASYFALRDALAAGAKPGLVVVDFVPFVLAPGYRFNHQFLPEAAGLGACLDLAWTGADLDLASALALAWLVPSVEHRVGLRDRIGRLVAGSTGSAARPSRTRRPDLWLPGNDEAVFDLFYPTAWEPGAEHRSYVDRFVTLARAHGATVVWLMPPVSAPIQREWDALGLSARYTRFAASVQAAHPELIVIDARQIPVTAADLLDPLHLNPKGAEAFTSLVADALLDADPTAPGGSRWIDLAAVAPADHAEPLIQAASVVH